jgi:cell division inhibitor SepF
MKKLKMTVSKRIVLMSLDGVNRDIARRILDFMAGAAYASEGKIARISSTTFVITPKNVDMMGSDMMDELESSGLFL